MLQLYDKVCVDFKRQLQAYVSQETGNELIYLNSRE